MAEANYLEMVQQAEQAVAGVKDADLKKVAFEKILDALLSGGGSSDDHPQQKKVAPSGSRRSKAPAADAVRKPRGPKGYVTEMIADGFFAKPKAITDVKIELANRGHHFPLEQLSTPLMRLCRDKKLRRHKSDVNGKSTFVYSNW